MTLKSILRSETPRTAAKQTDSLTFKVCDNDSLHDLSSAWRHTPLSSFPHCIVCDKTTQTDIYHKYHVYFVKPR